MKFIAMIFSAALLLHIAVTLGEFYSTERIEGPEKRRMLDPKIAAKTLYENIRQASPELPPTIQMGFLYLHGNDPNINYGNTNLRKAISQKKLTTKLDPKPPTERPAFYPANPRNTNLLIALPNKKSGASRKESDNHGHSEHKLLEQLDELREGYYQRNRFESDKCPKYVILSTYLNPCYDEGKTRKFGCAQDYVEAKDEFSKKCSGTKFYLYVPVPNKRDSFWDDIEKLMKTKNIDILSD